MVENHKLGANIPPPPLVSSTIEAHNETNQCRARGRNLMRSHRQTPELLPILSRGKHRNARRGACFMEYASVIAGDAWSDHPPCTDPGLASLARMVNDCTADSARNQLLVLVPSVIGVTGGGVRTSVRLAARAASAALPIASEGRQRALAAGMLRLDQILSSYGESIDDAPRVLIATALQSTPSAATWAQQFLATTGALDPRSIPLMTDAIIRTAVVGIADACVNDADDRLRELLTEAIADCREQIHGRIPSIDNQSGGDRVLTTSNGRKSLFQTIS